MAGLEAWEGGMARTKQWKKERYSVGLEKNLKKNLPKNASGIFWKMFLRFVQALSNISLAWIYVQIYA